MTDFHGRTEMPPSHAQAYALIHDAMRRDAVHLAGAATTIPVGQYGRVQAWWREVERVIAWHHRSQEQVLWPRIIEAVPALADQRRAVTGDHAAMHRAVSAVGEALDGSSGARLSTVALKFHDVIHEHLRLEEATVYPIFRNDLSRSDLLSIEREVLRSAGPRVLVFLLPWMFDGVTGTRRRNGAANIPPPVRFLAETVLRARYRRLRWN